MEAQTDMQTYLEQGKRLLAQGQGREAAIAYAHAAQLEPENPLARLGLAEANLALGNYDIVRTASRHVQQLEPADGIESMTAQALLDVLDKRYDRALQQVETIIGQNPGIAYIHALRSYLLRIQRQDYDANLARARAARLSYGGRFENVFPPAEPLPSTYAGRPTYPGSPPVNTIPNPYSTGYTGQADKADRVDDNPYSIRNTPPVQPTQPRQEREQREQVPPWTPSRMQRQMIRTRFALSQHPGLITYIFIVINLVVFLFALLSPTVASAAQLDGFSILKGQYWRFLTAMFLNVGIIQIAFNMLSLYFVGRATEIFYGKWRYVVLYIASGILSGVVFLAFFALQGQIAPAITTVTGAIFGIFGSFGTFFLVNRRSLGIYGRGAISNWLFWLGLNLVYGVLLGSFLSLLLPVSGLVIGMLLGLLLVPRISNRRRML